MVTKEWVNSMFSIDGKVAIVTGASGALGGAVARGYAFAGAKVLLTARNEQKLTALCSELTAAGCSCAIAAGDPAVEADARYIVAQAVAAFGEVNILTCCHGLSIPKSVLEQSTEEWQSIMDANVKGTYLMAKYVAKQMVTQKKGGKMVLTSSARSKRGMKNYTGYSTSKAATDLLAQSLACDLGEYGITVNTFNPTVFRSDLTEWMFHDDNVYQGFMKRLPIGRLGEPEDFVGICIFLASTGADFITGANIAVDGGYWGN